jgi:hypothetical protein
MSSSSKSSSLISETVGAASESVAMLGHHARGKVVVTVDSDGKSQNDTTT